MVIHSPEPSGPSLQFENLIPFAPLAQVQVTEEFKRRELAWKFSLHGVNPIIWIPTPGDEAAGALAPTGFEPYFLGQGLTPRAILAGIAEIGAQELESLARRHPENESYVARLLSVLQAGRISPHDPQRNRDIQALSELDAALGGLTRRLGARAQANEPARRYREDTHRFTDPFVGRLTYSAPAAGALTESYQLPDVDRDGEAIAPAVADLPTFRLRRGWRFMRLLGDRLGVAPVRAGLQGRWQRLPLQFRY
jgi:hypothetical protein